MGDGKQAHVHAPPDLTDPVSQGGNTAPAVEWLFNPDNSGRMSLPPPEVDLAACALPTEVTEIHMVEVHNAEEAHFIAFIYLRHRLSVVRSVH